MKWKPLLRGVQKWIFLALLVCKISLFKGCIHDIFAILFCKFKGQHLCNKENIFNFTWKALFVLEICKFLYFCLPSFSPCPPHYLREQSNNLGFWDPVSSNHLNSPNTIKQVKLNSWTVFTAKYQTIHKTRHFIIFQIYKEKNIKKKLTNITLSLRI